MGYDWMEKAFALVERLGLPLAIAAWATVFLAAIGLAVVLRGRSLRGVLVPALIVGVVGLAAHLLDYFVTLRISPDLAMEANPIWRIALDHFGLRLASRS